jgi:hypothetical protein
MTARRLAPLSGIVAVVLIVIAFGALGQSTPGIKASPDKVASFYAAHSGREQGASFLIAIATFFLVVYAAALRGRLAGSAYAGSVWPNVAFAGGILAALGFGVAATIHLALAEGAHHYHLVPSALQALNALDNDSFIPIVAPVAILLLGAAGAWIRGAGAARWLGWIALILGVLAFTPVGFFAFLAGGIWIAVTSVFLFMTERRQAEAVMA